MATDVEFSVKRLLRENIREIKPYSSARDEYTGTEGIFLDANENAYGSAAGHGLHRYPDPLQRKLKEKIGEIKGANPTNIFVGNGSDEPIDLLFRAFCEPGKDTVITLPPTYGMYRVCADINGTAVKTVALTESYDIDVESIFEAVDENTKLIFVCSPNNPTGNLIDKDDIIELLTGFHGIVVVDEAYIDFAQEDGFLGMLDQYSNLVILQTFSKAWGMAALRVGMAFASEEIINVLNKIKYPYNINEATQRIALRALKNIDFMKESVNSIIDERAWLKGALGALSCVEYIYPSDANFLLVKVTDPVAIYNYLIDEHKVIVRDRSKVTLCDGCLRITVGTESENQELINGLREWKVS